MTWADLSYNPGAMVHYFSVPPSLERVDVLDASLHVSSLHLEVRVPVHPDIIQPRIRPGADACHLVFGFWHITDFLVEGWEYQDKGDLSIIRRDVNDRIAFCFQSDGCLLRGLCKSFEVVGVSFTSEAEESQRKTRLFSHYNVWNSCLSLAKAKGFSVQITGSPDRLGEMSYCQWLATKDKFELKAENPIELAGLIALFEYHQPVAPRDYWWRIDGPNRPNHISEAEKAWNAKHFGPPDDKNESIQE